MKKRGVYLQPLNGEAEMRYGMREFIKGLGSRGLGIIFKEN